MSCDGPGRVAVKAEVETWPLRAPFQIAGRLFKVLEVLVVTLEKDGRRGRGEAAGVYYRDDRPADMLRSVFDLAPTIGAGVSAADLQALLPPGGARNALDCALWDLQAKLAGAPVWRLAGLSPPKPLTTTFTCGADAPGTMAAQAVAYAGARALKLKLLGDDDDADRVRAVRGACPDVWIGVDPNQGLTRQGLAALLPTLVDCGVALIEQPFPVGEEAWLDDLGSPIPIAADESVQSLADLEALAGRVQVINIKLDKCGGLTEGLAMARTARALGFEVMVGNMMGTSLAMAPAYLLGQSCGIVDLDGAVFLATDRRPSLAYAGGYVRVPDQVWGGP